MANSFYTVDAKTKGVWLLDGVTRNWADSNAEIVRRKRLLRPICLEIHLYKELGNHRRMWIKGWKREDRHSPWKPVKEEP